MSRMSFVPDEVLAFIDEVSALPAESLQQVRHAVAVATASGARKASDAPKLSASELDALIKRISDAFAARADELRALTPRGALNAAIVNATVASQAIWKRDRLTEAQFESFAGMYRDVGIAV
ncbi:MULTISPECIES: hypothetical protein [Microbacterium]|uniref:hypothetical protein n=1 Tax=Microbacterium TaxID=33882 RepID=UPI00217EBA0A|nr:MULTISPECIES: hypothetical protein [Microbacterium]UWF78087.1 hypothetical protein JSY13_03345 [Microbacterium neungamense]WCM56265.1 hypothetical protein JRG78_03370 [Microbacterium sp. EF45047]